MTKILLLIRYTFLLTCFVGFTHSAIAQNWKQLYEDEAKERKKLDQKFNSLNNAHQTTVKELAKVNDDLRKLRKSYDELLKSYDREQTPTSPPNTTLINDCYSQVAALEAAKKEKEKEASRLAIQLETLTLALDSAKTSTKQLRLIHKREVETQVLLVDSLKQELVKKERELNLQKEICANNKSDCDTRIDRIQTDYNILSTQLSVKETELNKSIIEYKSLKETYLLEVEKNQNLNDQLTATQAENAALLDGQTVLQKRLNQVELNFDTTQRKLLHFKKRWNQSIFVALNYSLLRSPERSSYEKNIIATLDKSWDYPTLIQDIGFAIYTPIIGVFFSNPTFNNETQKPSQMYDIQYIKYVESVLQAQGGSYAPLTYQRTIFDGQRFNVGANLHIPYTPLYLLVGLGVEMGESYDLYTGYLGTNLPANYKGMFATNYKSINTQQDAGTYKGIVGIAYVDKFFQAEVGYSQLNKGVFVNVGSNLPFNIRKNK